MPLALGRRQCHYAAPMASWTVLPGLPSYGPAPDQFPDGRHAYREGLVVKFNLDSGSEWLGNFQLGMGGVNAVLPEPGTDNLIVIAGGDGYLVEPSTRRCLRRFGGGIKEVFRPRPDLIVCSNGLWMEGIGPSGVVWRSRRISWDGFRAVDVGVDMISGESWTPLGDTWVGFTVDVRTGVVQGGAYPTDMARSPHVPE